MAYKKIKTKYTRQKVKQTEWEDREYIDDLIRLEHWIENGPSGMASAMCFSGLQSQYPEEYLELLKELKPEKVPEKLAERREKEQERKAKAYEEWIRAGGKPI